MSHRLCTPVSYKYGKENKDFSDFIKKEKAIIRELIRGKVMVQDYNRYNIKIYVYNFISEQGESDVISITSRVLETERGMEKLEIHDALFKLDSLRKKPYRTTNVKIGKPNRPRDQSIQKAIQIQKYIKEHPNVNREYICKKFGSSKGTYYRTIKWLGIRGD